MCLDSSTTPVLTVAYDANGNTLTDASGKSYTWDFENRLVSAVVPGTGTVTFKYDPFGRRVQKSSALGTTNYLYERDTLLEEVGNSGNVLASYTHSPGIDKPLAEIRSGTASYYEQDGQGSVSSVSNSAGSTSNTYTYDSYGKVTASTGTIINPLKYAAREFDIETGLYYNRSRFYDPATGRWLSEDPIRFIGGVDFYAYVLNNPLRFRDPFGRQGEVADCFPDCVHSQQEQAQMQREHDQLMQQLLGPDPSVPDQGPGRPPIRPKPENCDHHYSHQCIEAYAETATGGVVILGSVAGAWYVGPLIFEEGSLEGLENLIHTNAVHVPGLTLYGLGLINIAEHCPLFVDWFLGPAPYGEPQ
jgi:RHS repeat-associated protein